MGYSYRTRQQRDLTSTVTSGVPRPARAEPPSRLRPAAEPETAEPTTDEVSYRDLQAQAKEAGIPANQSREDLEAALKGAT